MTPLFTTRRFWTALAALLALLMLPLPFEAYPQLVDTGPTWHGIDDSARLALNYAWKHGWDWGHDIVYTYGPLSFLSTRIGWFVPKIAFLLFDLFLVANFFFLFRDFIMQSRQKTLAVIAIILLMLCLPLSVGSGLVWILMVFCFYWMLKGHHAFRWGHAVMLITLVTITFFLKLNTGLFMVFFFIGYLVLMMTERRLKPLMGLGVTVLLAIAIWLSSIALHVSLPAYVRGAIEVMKGYNDLMYLTEKHWALEQGILAIFCSIVACLVFAFGYQAGRRKLVLSYMTLMSIAYFFLLKKQAMFRNDTQHLFEFFPYVPLFFFSGITARILPLPESWRHGLIIMITVLCFTPVPVSQPLAESLGQAFWYRFTVPLEYFRGVKNSRQEAYVAQGAKRYLPERVLQRIGNSRVDVFPWDANYLLQHGLNYAPRPCFQTFQANTDYLQDINYSYYWDNGPAFVLYDYDAIDNAYPFNDAPLLNLYLCRNYKVMDTFSSNERWRILLQRNVLQQELRLVPSGTQSMFLNNQTAVAGQEFLKLGVRYTLRGRLLALWDRPDPLTIAYQSSDGEWHYQKSSTELLKTGIYTDRFIRSNQEFARLASADTLGLLRVNALKIMGDTRYYRKDISAAAFNVQ